MIVLFQGDSVTDSGRDRENTDSLGEGYPALIAKMLDSKAYQVFNRGVSGNRTRDLVERWEKDTLRLQPDILTVLIGINDCWRKYDQNDETPIAYIEKNLRTLLTGTDVALPGVRLILMEPFMLPVLPERKAWRVTLDPIISLVRDLAYEFKVTLVPLDGALHAASIQAGSYEAIAADGIHPTPLGHQTIANAWMDTFKTI